MTWEQLCKLGLALPEVEVGPWYRTPSLKVRGKGFVRLKEDGASVVFMLESVDEQEFLTRTQPELYFITDHYLGYPCVLARLSALRAPEARKRIEQGWKLKATKALVSAPVRPKPPARTKRAR